MGEELPAIDYDRSMDRTYIPLPGGWEIQTKGNGSTFRIAHAQQQTRWQVLDDKLHEPLEAMARDMRDAIAPYAERIRQLERELATFKGELATQKPAKSIDTPEFRKLLADLVRRASYNISGKASPAALIAYIDGRTAGAAPAVVEAEPAVGAPRSREWQLVTRPGQVRKGDKLRFKIGDKRYDERAKLILHPGTDKEEVIYDKGRNYYFITAMVMSGFSNHKCVEVLAAAPTPMNSGKEEA
jgi:hypothetical protein